MDDEIKIEPYYQKRAKDLVDFMFNNGLLNPKFSRDHMDVIENYVAFLFQSIGQTAERSSDLLHKVQSIEERRIKE